MNRRRMNHQAGASVRQKLHQHPLENGAGSRSATRHRRLVLQNLRLADGHRNLGTAARRWLDRHPKLAFCSSQPSLPRNHCAKITPLKPWRQCLCARSRENVRSTSTTGISIGGWVLENPTAPASLQSTWNSGKTAADQASQPVDVEDLAHGSPMGIFLLHARNTPRLVAGSGSFKFFPHVPKTIADQIRRAQLFVLLFDSTSAIVTSSTCATDSTSCKISASSFRISSRVFAFANSPASSTIFISQSRLERALIENPHLWHSAIRGDDLRNPISNQFVINHLLHKIIPYAGKNFHVAIRGF